MSFRLDGGLGREGKRFFFEKKNQKTLEILDFPYPPGCA
jgi:hypothetical protein